MTNLLWPGDHRAGLHMTDQALLRSMVAVESAWLSALAAEGLAPADAANADLSHLVDHDDMEALAVAAENSGSPIAGLVELLRQRATPTVAPWIHRGLTSQDVVDTALMLGVRDVVDELRTQLYEQVSTLAALADVHRATPMVARTLTQLAAPTTFGTKAAGWCNGVLDAYERLRGLATPIQVGGAVGTCSATTELATLADGRGRPGGGCGSGNANCRGRFGSGRADPVAHHPDAGDGGRGCLRRVYRQLGSDRLGRGDSGSSGNRRAERAGRRTAWRLVFDAAQAQSGVVHLDTTDCANRLRNWRRPCIPPRPWPTTNARMAHGMPNGRRCGSWPGGP